MVGDEAEEFPGMARITQRGEGWGFMHINLGTKLFKMAKN